MSLLKGEVAPVGPGQREGQWKQPRLPLDPGRGAGEERELSAEQPRSLCPHTGQFGAETLHPPPVPPQPRAVTPELAGWVPEVQTINQLF